jgi:hypothetical protein
MKFGGFKLGKKDKEAPQEEAPAELPVDGIEAIVQDVEPVRPHAPLQELSLDAEVTTEGSDGTQLLDPTAVPEEEGEPVKLAEIQINPADSIPPPPPQPKAASAPPPPPAPIGKDTAKKTDLMDLGASIGNIFNDLEDEANPLANLIKVLPDVAATELIDDLKEINDIIKDWQKK